jgi:TolB-like protein
MVAYRAFAGAAVLETCSNGQKGSARSFADGLSHDIIRGLERLRTLFVMACGSTFALREQTSDPQEIGRAISVDYAATGSVVRNGDRLLITVELFATDGGRAI